MTYEEIVQEIIATGKNPDDFNITILDNGYKVEPRASYEIREVAKKENEFLEQENADLWFESMTNESRIESAETEVANLWYEVMVG